MEPCEYAVRGACIYCEYGTHTRRLNLPTCHGVYVNEHPIMNATDCKAEENISYLGICKHPDNPSTETIYLINMEGKQEEGKPCEPLFYSGTTWKKTKETTLIDGEPALTKESELYCAHGGVIHIERSGQHEEG
jgi:hypothetical protein